MATTNCWNNQVLAANVTFNGGTMALGTDSQDNAINIGTAANAGRTVTIGNATGTSTIAINCGTGGITVGTSANAHATTLGSTNSTSSTTVQSGSGALNITSTNGAQTHNSGTGIMGISTDAANTTVNIGTGAAIKAVTLGSTNTTSSTTINFGGSSGSALSSYISGGTFVPVLSFGGGTTGITYLVQTGTYTRIGSIVVFSININLTNKGSSVGNAVIAGLPVTAANTNYYISEIGSITFAGNYIMGTISSGGTSLALQIMASGADPTGLANGAFANTSSIYINGTYLV